MDMALMVDGLLCETARPPFFFSTSGTAEALEQKGKTVGAGPFERSPGEREKESKGTAKAEKGQAESKLVLMRVSLRVILQCSGDPGC